MICFRTKNVSIETSPPRGEQGSFRLPRGDIVPVFLLGAIGFGCYQMLWTVALQTVPAGDSALLIAATPVMTALLAMALNVAPAIA